MYLENSLALAEPITRIFGPSKRFFGTLKFTFSSYLFETVNFHHSLHEYSLQALSTFLEQVDKTELVQMQWTNIDNWHWTATLQSETKPKRIGLTQFWRRPKKYPTGWRGREPRVPKVFIKEGEGAVQGGNKGELWKFVGMDGMWRMVGTFLLLTATRVCTISGWKSFLMLNNKIT